MTQVLTRQNLTCYHCGDRCRNESISTGEKLFCCKGCKFVYELLSQNNLNNYYRFEKAPGITFNRSVHRNRFAFLDNQSIREKLLDFTDTNISRVTFFIPQIHCTSCIWLLENLNRLNPGIRQARVDFSKKELTVIFTEETTSLRQLVELLDSIGYEPRINLDDLEIKPKSKSKNRLYTRLAVAGFCFANIMLFSFPEYLAIDGLLKPEFRKFFGYLNILLALPVIIYCSSIYFSSAYNSLKQKIINIDVPITIGILILFCRSLYEILSGVGTGYMDSFSGLVFFLLIGKLFQKKTYDSLSFERDYKSYFPISVTRINNDKEENIPVTELEIGNIILIRNQELIPADANLLSLKAVIDYSFVTGESEPVEKFIGETIYAGGKQVGAAIELEVIKKTSQSYITQLWNDDAFKSRRNSLMNLVDRVSKYFTLTVLLIAVISALYWIGIDSSKAANAATAVLIIACPCALALSTPFTLGTTMRILGRNKLYLKNSSIVESLAKINTIIFDKTGTLTKPHNSSIDFIGKQPSNYEIKLIKSLTRQSTHPLSYKIFNSLPTTELQSVQSFKEVPGEGLEGIIDDNRVRIGSAGWVGVERDSDTTSNNTFSTKVYVSVNETVYGYFRINSKYRDNLEKVISKLSQKYELAMLSGDNENEKKQLNHIFNNTTNLLFNQSPRDKLSFIKKQQLNNKKVLMLGDGLNDAGALKQSDVGIAVCEDVTVFTPSSDAILDSTSFNKLERFISLCNKSIKIIMISFGISFLYNIIGLSFAVQGLLSPVLAAILMPLSSISVVIFTTMATSYQANRIGLK